MRCLDFYWSGHSRPVVYLGGSKPVPVVKLAQYSSRHNDRWIDRDFWTDGTR